MVLGLRLDLIITDTLPMVFGPSVRPEPGFSYSRYVANGSLDPSVKLEPRFNYSTYVTNGIGAQAVFALHADQAQRPNPASDWPRLTFWPNAIQVVNGGLWAGLGLI